MAGIKLIIDTKETLKFSAYCLRTDSWHDYQAFISEAKRANDVGDHRTANRSLRAALLFFFAHMEGVLYHICAEKHISNKTDSIYKMTNRVEKEAQKIDSSIPTLNFRLEKHLRDLVSHTLLTKEYEDEHGHMQTLTQDSVFEELCIPALERLEAIISPWLDRVCQALGVERFTDTEGRCKNVVELLGKIGPFDIHEV